MTQLSQIQVLENKVLARRQPTGSRRGTSYRKFYANSRIHIFQKGATILDNLVERRRRPTKLYREIVLGVYPELKGHIRWSQTAGCGCGCSPGFIVDHTVRANHTPADIFITIGAAEVEEPVDTSYVDMALA